ncbi:MAG: acyl-CoA oxidase [Deltaproteobacteria bacterium]|nr:acyl-CoA oxidase [Deltaproteobacteria bacterium]HCH62485.1 acyl-CoA oxidase [Deltaproteobacteria bacterium]
MKPSERLLTETAYLPYLPLIYVAWSDGELLDAEVDRLRHLAAVELAPGIDDEPVLASWLDPHHPPRATDLLRILRRVREVALRLPPGDRASLAELGAAMGGVEGAEASPSVWRAVTELQVALELSGRDALRTILRDAGVPVVVDASRPQRPPAFHVDRGALCRFLDGRHHALRNRLRDRLACPPFERPIEPTRAEYREQVLAWLQVLADEGYGGLAYPRVVSSSDDLGEFIAAFEVLADFDLSLLVKFGVQFGLFGGAIYFLGTERHHTLLHDVATLRLPGCFAMTEIGHGSNVRALGTTATYAPETDTLVIHTPDRASWKDYIGNAALHGQLAVVFAQLVVGEERPGVHAILVPIRTPDGRTAPGVSIEDDGLKLGLNGVDNGRIAFDQVHVPRTALLDRYGRLDAAGTYSSPIASATRRFFTMLGTLVAGRISVACAGVAAARSALAIAIRYGDARRQFGPAGAPEHVILDYPSHMERLLPHLAENIVLTIALRETTERYVRTREGARKAEPESGDERQLESLAAGLKALGTWHATGAIQESRECCGGAGYLAENRFAALKADTDVFTTFEGDNTVLLQLAARGVLTAFAASLSGPWTGVMRHLAERASHNLAGWDPLEPRRTDPEHLRDLDWLCETLELRVKHLTWSAAGRIRSRVKAGMDPFFATVDIQDHILMLGRAWSEHQALGIARAAVADLPLADPLRPLLSHVLRVRGLDAIWTHQAWFLRHERLSPNKVRALRGVRREALETFRTVAVDVVGAFGFDDAMLGAPIARDPMLRK